jgi:hypothetical protein
MQARKLFQRPFDITQFRRVTSPAPPVVHTNPVPDDQQVSAAGGKSTPTTTTVPDDDFLKCFDKSPPDLAAGVKKPMASPPRPVQTPHVPDLPVALTTFTTDDDENEKKRKKHKKEKKQRRHHHHEEEVEGGGDPFVLFCSAADSLTSMRTSSSAGATVPTAVDVIPSKKRPYEQAFNPDFETYMSGQAETVNDAVKQRHALDIASVSASAGGKSMGERKYGCLFCGGIHQLESAEKGNDPPCMRNGAFAKFIQDFLFRYDIAPDQEWRRLFMFKTPGFRRAMADRFAIMVSHDPSDAEWTSMMHRRSWETRFASFKSNAGNARDLFQQQRANEFIYFNSAGSSSPRPGSALMFGPVAASPVNLEPPPIAGYSNPYWVTNSFSSSSSSSSSSSCGGDV